MDAITSNSSAAVKPTTLSRKQLTIALVGITLMPFFLVVFLYFSMPSHRDPELVADVEVGPAAWPSSDAENAHLVPSVILGNPTNEPWNYINMSINHQFHFTHPDPLPAGDQIVVPLKFFHTKGNAFYPPETQRLRELTIYAQVPSGARAILSIEGEELDFEQPGWVE